MRKLLFSLVIAFTIIFNSVGANAAEADVHSAIDTQHINSGIVSVSYNSSSDKRLKVSVAKSGKRVYYNLNNDGITESFPLQLGNGEYTVAVYENISGDKYKLVTSKNVSLKLSNDKLVYLSSIQNIDWNTDMDVIKKAEELTKGLSSEKEKIEALYKYIVGNIKYDYDKMSQISTTYVPNIEQTYDSNKGICYDFSSMFASMLRSAGIPAKLVKGYSDNASGYHAWNEVYDSDSGKWIVIDTTYDSQMHAAKHKYSMIKSVSDYSKVYEY